MGIRQRLTALLADDDQPEPQAQDRRVRPYAFNEDSDRVTPPKGDIEDWTEIFYENPLIRVPITNFAQDVTEPGVRITVDGDDDTDLGDDLEDWLDEAAIIDGEFDKDFSDLLEDAVIDKYGRRGTAMVEHVYDDAEQREQLLAFRLFKVETVTAYTRPGKNILLREDDDPVELVKGNRSRQAPETKAGVRAAYVQYDDVFGHRDENENRFAIKDVTKLANDTDTGEIFGEPATSSVYDRAKAIREKLADLDTGIKAKAYKYWLVQLPGVSKERAEDLVADMALNDPSTKTVVNQKLEVEAIDGEVPDIVDTLQFDVEYILSGLPTPLYQAGFAGDINRDVTDEQESSYREKVRRERKALESAFNPIIQRKAEELKGESAPDVELHIEPEADESPLADENFDAQAFLNLTKGLKQAKLSIDEEAFVEQVLKMDPDEILTDEEDQPTPPEMGDAPPGQLPPDQQPGEEDGPPQPPGTMDPDDIDESDPQVQAAFKELNAVFDEPDDD